MKKTILTLTALALGTALAFGIAACDDTSASKNENGSGASSASVSEVYGFSALSAGTLISAMNSSDTPAAAAMSFASARAASVTDEETITMLNEHMLLVESILSDGVYSVSNETSDRENYAVKEIVSYKDMLGETVEYVLYYNQVEKTNPLRTVSFDTADEDDFDDDYRDRDRDQDRDRDDFHDDDDNEIKTEYRIEGILVVGEKEYPVRGEKESETEYDESELETEFIVTLDSQTGKYMTVEQSVSQESGESEQEYTYSLYENGALLERTSLEYEEERNETEIELEIYDRETNQATRFYFEDEGNKGITIRIGDRNATESYRVTIVTNDDGTTSYLYEYAGGQMHFDRH